MKFQKAIGRLTGGVFVALVLVASAFALEGSPATATPAAAEQNTRKLNTARKVFTGDFDQLLERRKIRVLVPYSRSLYFNDKGHEMGLSAENVRDFDAWINKKYKKKLEKRPLTFYFIPVTRDRLLTEVAAGLGDIAVGNLTVTDERLKTVDFVWVAGGHVVKELVITGPKSPTIATTDDLSGRKIQVRRTSSYYESLVALNERFRRENRPEVKIETVPDALEDEDMMEMLNTGLLDAIIVDDWKAKMWAQVLPEIRVNEQAIIRDAGKTGWAVRKGSPKLAAELLEFYQQYLKKHGIGSYRLQKYMARTKKLKNAAGSAEMKRFENTLALFRKYGGKYGFDPLMLAAQGFQESRLNQNFKSHRGAVGVMQVMPATGRHLKVGDVRMLEPNIHAGAKYMDELMTKYFADADFKGDNRTLFAFASYNCGPGKVAKMRRLAEKQGYDPNEWFNNVEIVVGKKVGMETTTYVRNIFKYYTAYKLQLEVIEAERKAREQMAPTASK